jgi:hypothetical protein
VKLQRATARVCALLLIAAPVLAITRKFRLYNTDSGQKIDALFRFKWSSMSGKVEMQIPGGEKLEGEYSGSHDGGVAWGSIYSGSASATSTMAIVGNVRGSMIATGPSGLVLQCEYVTNTTTTHGSGACKDNRGALYKLLF